MKRTLLNLTLLLSLLAPAFVAAEEALVFVENGRIVVDGKDRERIERWNRDGIRVDAVVAPGTAQADREALTDLLGESPEIYALELTPPSEKQGMNVSPADSTGRQRSGRSTQAPDLHFGVGGGISAGYSGTYGEHFTPPHRRPSYLTTDIGLFVGPGTLVTKWQLPGGLFHNAKGRLHLSQIALSIRPLWWWSKGSDFPKFLRYLCLNFAYTNMIDRVIRNTAALPDQDILMTERAPGLLVGLGLDLADLPEIPWGLQGVKAEVNLGVRYPKTTLPALEDPGFVEIKGENKFVVDLSVSYRLWKIFGKK
jgi:hypothetical protein